MAAYDAKGLVETLHAKWQGPFDAMSKYEASGRAVRLEIAAQPGTPGVRGATVDFDLTQAGGQGKLRLRDGAIDLPDVFEEPLIAFDELSADLQWQVNGEEISASVANLKFSNADAQGEGQIGWRTGDASARFPGVLDLQAGISRADGARIHRYLPLGVPKEARHYVRESVVQGTATGARFRVKGDLRHFPFKNPRHGEFRITADVRDVTYAFVPPSVTKGTASWPALTQLSGALVFERNGMQVKGAVGHFAGAPRLQVKADAHIADFQATTVAVTGDVRGPLAEALGVVSGSPLSAMTGHALDKATGSGNADVRLKLELPLANLDKSKLQGSVTLAGNDIRIIPESPLLSRARGAVTFNERGFSLVGTQARALGGDVRVEGGSRAVSAGPAGSAEATVVVRVQGTATAEGLRQARELGFLSRMARDATGGAAYNVNLSFRRGTPEIAVSTNLQGLALNLPSPLAKTAEAVLPVRYENALVRESRRPPARHLQDQLTVEIGRLASVVYVRDLSGSEPRVIRGGVAVGLAAGESAPVPEYGVMANINLANVNVDAWEEVLGPRAAGEGAAAAAGGPSPCSGQTVASRWGTCPRSSRCAPRNSRWKAGSCTTWSSVARARASSGGATWMRTNSMAMWSTASLPARVPAGCTPGSRGFRSPRRPPTPWRPCWSSSPTACPALDIVVDDFELRGKKLGRLEIDAANRGAGTVAREGGVREWRLNKLNLSMPEATFSATGNWAAVGAQAAAPGGPRPGPRPAGERRRTAMKFRLDIADSGQLLARFGMKDVIRRGKGRMEGQMAWLGSPLSLDYPSLDGAFYVNFESGQFLKADPGMAKLLGVLSLQSLPRRLALDFRDVFSDGFAFDFVRGDVTIQHGIAATNNLQMKGVNAAVLMEGRADIAKETQDLKVVVVPEINAGTASLVATVISPAIGLGTFLAQMFLREPLMRAATQEFHIDGTWTDPRVARVNRKPVPESRTDAATETQRAGGTN